MSVYIEVARGIYGDLYDAIASKESRGDVLRFLGFAMESLTQTISKEALQDETVSPGVGLLLQAITAAMLALGEPSDDLAWPVARVRVLSEFKRRGMDFIEHMTAMSQARARAS